jgi:hypothetical protein
MCSYAPVNHKSMLRLEKEIGGLRRAMEPGSQLSHSPMAVGTFPARLTPRETVTVVRVTGDVSQELAHDFL